MLGMTQSMARTLCALTLGLVIQLTAPAMSADEPAQPGPPGTPPTTVDETVRPPADIPAAADVPAAPDVAGDSAGIIAELRNKLADLEKRVTELEENKNEITAPFKVVSKTDDILFYVGETGHGQTQVDILGSNPIYIRTDRETGGEIKITGSNNTLTYLRAGAGKPYFEAASVDKNVAVVDAEDGLQLQVTAPDAFAVVGATPGAPVIRAITKAQTAFIGKSESAFGFFAVDGSGKRLASLDDSGAGSKYALKINPPDGSEPVVQVGYHKSGNPGVSLWKGGNKIAHLDTNEEGTAGILELMKNNSIVALMSADDGGVLSFLDENTSETVSLGRISENVNGLRVRDGSDVSLELVSREKTGELVLNEKGKLVSLLSAGEGGTLDFLDSELNETATFGQVEKGMTGMRLQDKGKKLIDLVVRPEGTGLYINKDEKLRAFVGTQSEGTPTLSVFDETGRLAELTSEGTQGSLILYDKGKMTLSAGSTEQKPIPAFRAWKDGQMKFAAGATPAGTGVSVVYGGTNEVGAGMEGFAAGGGKVYAYANGLEAVSINTVDNPGQGIVAVRGPDGKTTVAVMRKGTNGGGNFTAMDPTGGGIASLGYTPGGPGTVCVAHKGTQCLGVGLTGLEGFH